MTLDKYLTVFGKSSILANHVLWSNKTNSVRWSQRKVKPSVFDAPYQFQQNAVAFDFFETRFEILCLCWSPPRYFDRIQPGRTSLLMEGSTISISSSGCTITHYSPNPDSRQEFHVFCDTYFQCVLVRRDVRAGRRVYCCKSEANFRCKLIRVHTHVNYWKEEESATVQFDVLSAVKKFLSPVY